MRLCGTCLLSKGLAALFPRCLPRPLSGSAIIERVVLTQRGPYSGTPPVRF